MAVSKKFSSEPMVEAYNAGCRHFGESYVQEFATKAGSLGGLHGASFHLIGHLQSNKARQAVALFDVLETVDSARLLERVARSAAEAGQVRSALIEVKLAAEESKSGCHPDAIASIVGRARDLESVRLTGLMTVPPWSTDPEQSRPYFRQLAALGRQHGLPELSMGMSNDFEVAIEEGATTIRVGTALFGSRPKPV